MGLGSAEMESDGIALMTVILMFAVTDSVVNETAIIAVPIEPMLFVLIKGDEPEVSK